MFDPTVTDTYVTYEYGFDGTLVSTTAIDDASCEEMKNDPTLNVISCCFTTTVVSNRRLSEFDPSSVGRELQNNPEPTPEPSQRPSSFGEALLVEYRTNGFIVVTTPPLVASQITAIEEALETVLGDISVEIGGNGTQVFVFEPSAEPSAMPSPSGMSP